MALSIVFYKNNSIVSKIVRFLTNSETSHVAINLSFQDIDLLFHGTIRGVVMDNRINYEQMENSVPVAEFIVLPSVEQGFRRMIELLGQKYDTSGVIGLGIVVLARRWLHLKMKNLLASPKAMICSELVVHLNTENELASFSGLDPERTTPKDLLDICRSNRLGEFKEVIHGINRNDDTYS